MKKLNELDLLDEIISIDSSNPGPGEEELARFFQALSKEHGFESEILEGKAGRSNLIIRIDAGDGKKLGFSGHLDTKPVGDALQEWNSPPWKLTIDGDLGYGLGTSDMKGALAAFFVAASEWADSAKSGLLSLIFTADEEAGSVYGSKFLSEKVPLDVEAILVGEPSGVSKPWESIFTVSRGISCFEIIIHGRQGHSGLSRTLPTSANLGAAKAAIAISEMKLQIPKSFAPEHVTVNSAIKLSGGVTYGVHPGEAKVACDIRIIPGMQQQDVLSELTKTLNTALPSDLSWKIRWEEGFGWMEAVQIPDEHSLVTSCQRAAMSILGYEVPLGIYPGGTDASHFSKIAKIPSLASFGPGWLSVAHGPNECVGLSQVTQAKKMYKLILEDYLENH